MNKIIAAYILSAISRARRALESRAFARAVARRFRTSIYRVYGIISFLSRSGQLTFSVKRPGGLSYIR